MIVFSQVVAKGAGLNKFFPGRPAMFTIDTALAGEYGSGEGGLVQGYGIEPCQSIIVIQVTICSWSAS